MVGIAEPLEERGLDPRCNYLFVVIITSMTPGFYQCKIKYLSGAYYQSALTRDIINSAVSNGSEGEKGNVLAALDLAFKADSPSLVAFLLADTRVGSPKFEDPRARGDATKVVLRTTTTGTASRLYQSRWPSSGAGDQKAVCAILEGGAGARFDYILRAGAEFTTGQITYLEIDPKIQNDGEGGQRRVAGEDAEGDRAKHSPAGQDDKAAEDPRADRDDSEGQP